MRAPGFSFTTLAIVMGLAVAAPILVDLRRSLRLPSAVAEIVLGIVVGPSGLGWVHVDQPVLILSDLGLAALLFLAGLEINTHALRHGIGRLALGYAASVGLGVLVALLVSQVENIGSAVFVGFALASSTVGLVVPILRDAKATGSDFGQAVLAGASVGEFGAILLLSLFFSQRATTTGSQVLLLILFAACVGLVALTLFGLRRSERVSLTLRRLEQTSAQLGIRIALAIVGGFAALAGALGLETILAVFVAGVILRMVDQEERLIHVEFRLKAEAIGYGFLVPVFFITTGLQLNFRALFDKPGHLLLVPVFLLGLLIARGLPALAYRHDLGTRRALALGLLQSASLPVMVIAANLGGQLHVFDDPTEAALVVAGVLSVVLFPSSAMAVLERAGPVVPASARLEVG
jgi:Kef-type K+ transport system membrane component KefB